MAAAVVTGTPCCAITVLYGGRPAGVPLVEGDPARLGLEPLAPALEREYDVARRLWRLGMDGMSGEPGQVAHPLLADLGTPD